VDVDENQDQDQDVAAILDAMEQILEQARSMPMSSTVLVNRPDMIDLLSRARAALPTELADADEVLAGADEVLAQARGDAEAIIAGSRQRAKELVDNDQVVVAARARAAEVVADAEEAAQRQRREADDYCDRQLADFEIDLGRLLAQVQAGRAKLAGRLAEGWADR
jgi:hypothetical protein